MSGNDFVRRLLIISVGSSASIHLLGRISAAYPDLLFRNKIMIIESSRKMFNDAIDNLTRIYKRNYAKLRGRREEELKEGFPFSAFKAELRENSVLLAEGGGGATPERGLAYYSENREVVLDKIVNLVTNESGEREVSGIIVLGCAGKGTGTLVTPALTKDLFAETKIPPPLAFITIPFRFDRMSIQNAMKIQEYLKDVPLFLLDYERAIGAYVYLSGEVPEKEIPLRGLYNMVVGVLTGVLSTLIEALNYSTECDPPLDWSDIVATLLEKGYVGTVTYSVRSNKDEFVKYWKDDISTLLFLRTKSRPTRTSAVTIIRGEEVPYGIAKDVTSFFEKFIGASPRFYSLYRGPEYRMISLIQGFHPDEITPPLKPGKGILERLLGI